MHLIAIYKNFRGALKRKGLLVFGIRFFQCILAVPIALIILLISPIYKIRFIKLYSSRIGQYGSNTHLLLCALESNDYPDERNCKHFYYSYDEVPICNKFFHKMWSRTIPILPCGALCSFVDRTLIAVLKDRYLTPFKIMFEGSPGGYDQWGYLSKYKKQFISFTQKEELTGSELINQLGIPIDKPFVCLLVRDSKYLQARMPDTDDWRYHKYRDVTVENYISTIEFLTQNGFYVVRMGKEVNSALNFHDSKFIDYANHSLRSDFLDIYLSANCYFFISTATGIDCIASIFHRPLLMTNAILCDIYCDRDWLLTISKNVLCVKTNSLVPYEDIYRDYTHFYLSNKYIGQDPRLLMFLAWEKKGWRLIENTSDEILSAVKETVDTLANHFVETDEMKNQQELFWKCFPAPATTRNKTYKDIKMRISPSFLKKHINLLTSEPVCEIIQ